MTAELALWQWLPCLQKGKKKSEVQILEENLIFKNCRRALLVLCLQMDI